MPDKLLTDANVLHTTTILNSFVDRLVRERDEARYNARILAHAYKTGNSPPASVVNESLAYPIIPIK